MKFKKKSDYFLLMSVILFSGLLLKVVLIDFLSADKALTDLYNNLTSSNEIGKFTLTWVAGNNGTT